MKTREIISLYEKIEEIPSFGLPDTQRTRCLQCRNLRFFSKAILKKKPVLQTLLDPLLYFQGNVHNSNLAFMCMDHYYELLLFFALDWCLN